MSLSRESGSEADKINIETGIELLQSQIEAARRLLENRPIKSKDHEIWNKATRDHLTTIFGPDSPNIRTIVSASGSEPVWLGMSQARSERFDASSIENKIQLLENCIVSLRRKKPQ